jgi:hypothetical protein
MRIATTCCVLALAVLLTAGTTRAAWHFTDVTAEAGLTYQHALQPASAFREPLEVAGGVAAGDYDGDGWIDLYVVGGNIGPNLLFHNRGDGTFEEVGQAAGVAITGESASSASRASSPPSRSHRPSTRSPTVCTSRSSTARG